MTLGIYIDPTNIPAGAIADLDRYRVAAKEFDEKLAILRFGSGVAILGALYLAGIAVAAGTVGAIGTVLAGLVTFVTQPLE